MAASKRLLPSKICVNCGTTLTLPQVGIDLENLQTYCQSCRPDTVPAKYDQLASRIQDYYGESAEPILKILGNPAMIRMSPHQVMHVAKVAAENNLPSINATLQFIIERDIASHPTTDLVYAGNDWVKQRTFTVPVPEPEEVLKEIAGVHSGLTGEKEPEPEKELDFSDLVI